MPDQALEVWRDAIASPTSGGQPTLIFLCQLYHLPTPYLKPALPVVQKEKQISNASKVLKDLSKRRDRLVRGDLGPLDLTGPPPR